MGWGGEGRKGERKKERRAGPALQGMLYLYFVEHHNRTIAGRTSWGSY